MTQQEFEQGYYETSDDPEGPSVDPMDHAMVEHLVEFETEMFRLECRQRISRLTFRQLERMMIDLHGEDWQYAL
tara:strand:+ start:317 stop:538 length:222 start_codon:yes stop_codon:yes gene_type:complete